MRRFFHAPAYRRFLMVLLYVIVAAAAFNGFYAKWRLNDGHTPLSLASMVDGTAYRPYVYRQLVPAAANGIQALLPAHTVERLSERLTEPRRVNSRSGLAMRNPSSEAMLPAVTLRYHIVYYLTYLALLGALFAMRALCLRLGASAPAATIAPLALALLMPFFLTEGGFFYDFFELLSGGLRHSVTGRAAPESSPRRTARGCLLALVSVAATGTRRRSFFVATLYPLLRAGLPRREPRPWWGVLVFVCGCVYLALRMRFAGNPGGTVSFQPGANLFYFLDPGNWFRTEGTYGVIAAQRLLSAFMMLMIAGVCTSAGSICRPPSAITQGRRLPSTCRSSCSLPRRARRAT